MFCDTRRNAISNQNARQALNVFSAMLSNNVEPTAETVELLVTCCQRAKRGGAAHKVLTRAVKHGLVINRRAFNEGLLAMTVRVATNAPCVLFCPPSDTTRCHTSTPSTRASGSGRLTSS